VGREFGGRAAGPPAYTSFLVINYADCLNIHQTITLKHLIVFQPIRCLIYLFLQILRKLKHENIIEMLDSFESEQEFCVVTEFAQVTISFLISQKQINSFFVFM
jgi:hypothetical protein